MPWFMTFLLSFSLLAHAAEREGIQFPESVHIDTQDLLLNGTATRTATIFKVNVYVAGLYLPSKAAKLEDVLAQKGPKQVQMQFLRNVDAKDIRDAWNDSFGKACELHCDAMKEPLEALKRLMPDIKKGDRMTYTFKNDVVELAVNGAKRGQVKATEFPSIVLSTWIGKNPPTEAVRKGLLGQSEG